MRKNYKNLKNSEKAPELAKSSSTESVTKKVDKIKIEAKAEEKAQKMPAGKVEKTPPALWVEKYKPASMGKIVGQGGAASCAKKLYNWLQAWEKNQGCPKDQRPKAGWKGGKPDDPTGASCRAALLSGPPGVGKTTTAHQAAKELV